MRVASSWISFSFSLFIGRRVPAGWAGVCIVPSPHKAKTKGSLAHKFVKFPHFDPSLGRGSVPSGLGSPIWEINCTFLDQSDSVTQNYAVRPGSRLRNVPGIRRTGQRIAPELGARR